MLSYQYYLMITRNYSFYLAVCNKIFQFQYRFSRGIIHVLNLKMTIREITFSWSVQFMSHFLLYILIPRKNFVNVSFAFWTFLWHHRDKDLDISWHYNGTLFYICPIFKHYQVWLVYSNACQCDAIGTVIEKKHEHSRMKTVSA